MGADLGELFTELSDELTWMFLRWRQFEILYVEKESHLDILNKAAPFFFWLIQRTLWEDTVLGIARLAGPPRSAGKDNLAIRRIPGLVTDPTLRDGLTKRMDSIEAKTKFAMDWRNRHIAHRDLALALDRAATPLATATAADVNGALDEMAATLNDINAHLFNSETGFRYASSIWDAANLIFVLKDGLRREELRQAKLSRGEYDPVDWDDAPAD
jgi:hypothetical protein